MTTGIDATRDAPPPPPPPPSALPLAAPPPPAPALPAPETDDRLELPFTWRTGHGAPDDDERDTVFRFPGADDPRPKTGRLLGMSLYASVLGALSLAVVVRGLFSIVTSPAAGWPEIALVCTGLGSVALVIGAFLSVQRRLLPLFLLLAAGLPIVIVTIGSGR